MFFELTEKLVEDVIFAMENQNSLFVFDAEKGEITAVDSEIVVDDLVEKEKGFTLPSWDSEDGFNLREEFVQTVTDAKIRTELRQVLTNGRGVFRNFKNVLKQYPQTDRQFYSFKEKKMRSVVYDWYNSLRESWGLESLNCDTDDFSDLTREDFQFSGYNPSEDKDCIVREAGDIAEEIKAGFPDEAGDAIAQLWLRRFNYFTREKTEGVVCRTLSDDFAGCLLFSLAESSQNTAAFFTVCFVKQNYRGIGIARELFSKCIPDLKKRGVHYFIIAEVSVPDYLEPLLTRCGFEKKGSVYLVNLKADRKRP